MNKFFNFMTVIVFIIIILLPLIFFNKNYGVNLENENRNAASFPDIGNTSLDFKTQYNQWLNDNIGFRNFWITFNGFIKLHIFNTSPTEKVQKGKDGWYFYTQDNNISIAEGRYPLEDNTLEIIAEKQQEISDYYELQGKKYILVLTPSKTSIYPEFIDSGEYILTETPCDILEKYLKQNTTVEVLNLKHKLIDAKKNEIKLFLKTDTHFTGYGGYIAYCGILEKLNELEITSDHPMKVQIFQTEVKGEFVGMYGSNVLMENECVPDITFENNSCSIIEGKKYTILQQINNINAHSKELGTSLLVNYNKNKENLLIYGDSQWMECRHIPNLLSQHFNITIRTSIGKIDNQIDNIIDCDTIIFGCSERLINQVLL